MRSVAVLCYMCSLLFVACTTEKSVTSLSLQSFAKSPTVFRVMPGARKIIKGDQGTRLLLKGNEFEFEDGSKVKDTIIVELREVYVKTQMILNDVTTTSDGKLLESIGMFEIQATSEGKPLKIRKGRSIEVTIPNSRRLPGGELFYGHRDSTGINWEFVETRKQKARTNEPSKEEAIAVEEITSVGESPDSMRVQTFVIDDDGIERLVSDTTVVNDTASFFLPQREVETPQQNSRGEVKVVTPPAQSESNNTLREYKVDYEKPELVSRFWIGQVGWINIDRYIMERVRVKEPKKKQDVVELLVTLEKYKRPVGYVVFRDWNSVMRINFDRNGNALITDLPVNASVTVLTVDAIGDKFLLGQKDIVLGKEQKSFISPETLDEKTNLVKQIEKLGI